MATCKHQPMNTNIFTINLSKTDYDRGKTQPSFLWGILAHLPDFDSISMVKPPPFPKKMQRSDTEVAGEVETLFLQIPRVTLKPCISPLYPSMCLILWTWTAETAVLLAPGQIWIIEYWISRRLDCLSERWWVRYFLWTVFIRQLWNEFIWVASLSYSELYKHKYAPCQDKLNNLHSCSFTVNQPITTQHTTKKTQR